MSFATPAMSDGVETSETHNLCFGANSNSSDLLGHEIFKLNSAFRNQMNSEKIFNTAADMSQKLRSNQTVFPHSDAGNITMSTEEMPGEQNHHPEHTMTFASQLAEQYLKEVAPTSKNNSASKFNTQAAHDFNENMLRVGNCLQQQHEGLLHYGDHMKNYHFGLSNHRDHLRKLNSKMGHVHEGLLDHSKHLHQMHVGLSNHTDHLENMHDGLKNHQNHLSKMHTGLLNHTQNMKKMHTGMQNTDHKVNKLAEQFNGAHIGLLNHTHVLRENKIKTNEMSNKLDFLQSEINKLKSSSIATNGGLLKTNQLLSTHSNALGKLHTASKSINYAVDSVLREHDNDIATLKTMNMRK